MWFLVQNNPTWRYKRPGTNFFYFRFSASLRLCVRSTFPRPFDDDVNAGFVLGNHVGGQDAAPEDIRINHRAAPDDAARIQHGVTADIRAVAEQRAKFAQAGVERLTVFLDGDITGEHFEIGNFHARAQVRLVPENGVADVVEVRCLCAIEQQRVFDFSRITDHAVVADDDVFAQVGVVADFAVFTDDGRPFDHGAVLDHRAFADENLVTNKRPAFALIVERRFYIRGEVAFDFFERVPGKGAAIKNGGVFSLAEVKQVDWSSTSKVRIFITSFTAKTGDLYQQYF